MAETTKIEWCDHTASPWHGCAHAEMKDGSPHPGCLNCYAEAGAKRNTATLGVWGKDGTRVKSKSFIANLRRWNKQAEKEGRKVTVFLSICDPFEDRPELVPWRQEMFAVADECPNVILLLLTKRPQNVRRMAPETGVTIEREEVDDRGRPVRYKSESPRNIHPFRPNVYLGTSISDQPTADEFVPRLLECRDLCPVLFVSAEPLLSAIDLRPWLGESGVMDDGRRFWNASYISWLIIGHESGPHRRPGSIDHTRSLIQQGRAAGVAVFNKQMQIGPDRRVSHDPAEWPEDVRVREFPAVKEQPYA